MVLHKAMQQQTFSLFVQSDVTIHALHMVTSSKTLNTETELFFIWSLFVEGILYARTLLFVRLQKLAAYIIRASVCFK